MGFGYKNLLAGIGIVGKPVSGNSVLGDLEVLTSTNELYFYNGTTNSPLLTSDQPSLIQNKELEDSSVFFVDNLDNTKKLAFQVSGVTTGTTRTFTIPDFSDTIVGIAGVQTLTNKTIDADLNTLSNIDNNEIKAAAGIVYSKLNLTNSIVNTDINTAAAIARSKIAAGTANQVVINDGTGLLSSEAALSPSRGGTGVSNNAASTLTISGNFATTLTVSAITSLILPTTGTLATLAGTETLSNKTFSDAVTIAEIATPATPSSGFGKIYFKSDNKAYILDDNGVESALLTSQSTVSPDNFLYNGNFDLWQRNTSLAINNGTTAYLADRWYTRNALGTNSVVQITQESSVAGLPAKFAHKVRISVAPTAAQTNNLEVYQTLENKDSIFLYNQNASFQVKVTAVGNVNQIGVQFMYATSEAKVDTTIGSEVTSAVSGTPTTVTINGQALGTAMTSSGVIGVRIRATGVSTGNIYDANNGFVIEQAMVNLGTTAGTYKRKFQDIPSEIEACQRYYEKSYDLTTNPGANTRNGIFASALDSGDANEHFSVYFKAMKRNASYTLSFWDAVGNSNRATTFNGSNAQTNNQTGFINTASGEQGFEARNSTIAGALAYLFHWAVDAEI